MLLEHVMNEVECRKPFFQTEVLLRVFDDVKYVSTNEGTIVEIKDDMKSINLKSAEIKDSIVETQCIRDHVKKKHSKPALFVILNHTLDVDVEKELLTFQHCNKLLLRCGLCVALKLLVIYNCQNCDGGKVQTFTCFNDAVQSSSHKKEKVPMSILYHSMNCKCPCFILII